MTSKVQHADFATKPLLMSESLVFCRSTFMKTPQNENFEKESLARRKQGRAWRKEKRKKKRGAGSRMGILVRKKKGKEALAGVLRSVCRKNQKQKGSKQRVRGDCASMGEGERRNRRFSFVVLCKNRFTIYVFASAPARHGPPTHKYYPPTTR